MTQRSTEQALGQDEQQADGSTQKVALVTGANKGIGFEIAAGLGAQGYLVGVGARDEQRRDAAVASLRAGGADAFGVTLDVTDQASVEAAAAQIRARTGRLDVLVNNAGISGTAGEGGVQDPTRLDLDEVRRVLETNVFGVVRVTNAVLPLLLGSASPRIVVVSSTVGSLTGQADPDAGVSVGPVMAVYSPTKTYLNAIMLQYVWQLAGTRVLVNAVCPGLVATDFTGRHGREPQEGAAAAVPMATLPDGGPTGTFTDDEGEIPW